MSIAKLCALRKRHFFLAAAGCLLAADCLLHSFSGDTGPVRGPVGESGRVQEGSCEGLLRVLFV